MTSTNVFERVIAGGSFLCALIAVGFLARNSLRGGNSSRQSPVPTVDSVRVASWQTYAESGGHRIGPASAKVTVTVFTDFECPACRRFTASALAGARAEFQDQLRVVVRHWPLSFHRFALPAARASECASAQNRFVPYHDLLFAKQDSLGLKTFTAFASEAGVPDTLTFELCYRSGKPIAALEADTPLVSILGGRGTPLILVNDLVLRGGIDSIGLDAIIRAEFARK